MYCFVCAKKRAEYKEICIEIFSMGLLKNKQTNSMCGHFRYLVLRGSNGMPV